MPNPFHPSDHRALLALFILFVGAWSIVFFVDRYCHQPQPDSFSEITAIDSLEAQLATPHQSYSPSHASQTKPPVQYAYPERTVETFPFDPNTADSVALLRLGLPPWMVRNIYKYRARGGRYHSPQQFSHTYGMTGELWKRLGPMVRIGEDFKLLSETRHDVSEPGSNSDSATADAANTSSEGGSTGLRYPEKFKTSVKLDLNQTDTNELRRIPGIGSVYSRRIVRYRERLGGFVSLTQLKEVPDLPEGIEQWFQEPSGPIRRINVNQADFKTLRNHPYMTYEKARALADFRRIHGRINGLNDLQLMPEFSEDDLKRLIPYLDFTAPPRPS